MKGRENSHNFSELSPRILANVNIVDYARKDIIYKFSCVAFQTKNLL